MQKDSNLTPVLQIFATPQLLPERYDLVSQIPLESMTLDA